MDPSFQLASTEAEYEDFTRSFNEGIQTHIPLRPISKCEILEFLIVEDNTKATRVVGQGVVLLL